MFIDNLRAALVQAQEQILCRHKSNSCVGERFALMQAEKYLVNK